MYLRSRTWFLLSLLFLVAAIFFWLLGDERQAALERQRSPAPSTTNSPTGAAGSARTVAGAFPLMTQLNGAGSAVAAPQSPQTPVSPPAPPSRVPYRLSNTARTLQDLARSDDAILLRNALIDTRQPLILAIPDHLRSEGDPGSYIVQARGPIGDDFRARLREANASVISYIPNNAYLVRLSAAAARRLAAMPETRAVLPFEPYYKLDGKLLPLAVEQKPLPAGDWLRVTVFPGERERMIEELAAVGGAVVAEERTPFGPQLIVQTPPETLAALARMPGVQTIENFERRALMNDRTRVRLGISTSGSVPVNHLALTGTNVVVNVNDTGIQADHPDIAGRVLTTPDRVALVDTNGHGTHVAGIIAGSGLRSSTVTTPPPGSETNANFRGMAPRARLFTLPLEFSPGVNFPLTDTYLQETAARTNALLLRRTGPMISNNSWSYTGANEYDSSAARFDAAVRDALPELPDAQSMIYVFPSGGGGSGNEAGLGGDPNSIPSPGTAKNVITVGVLESLRNLTNGIVMTNAVDNSTTTNAPFLGITDSDNEAVAFSGRGNVGIGVEGQFGRFKPDLVAPGTFIISLRAPSWKVEDSIDPAVFPDEFLVLSNLNAALGPHYRYETGGSIAAPAVSGMLALMQEFFEQRLPLNLRRTNSPALMKALLINRARSAGPLYDFHVRNTINFQGWGQPNLTNTLPNLMVSQPESAWPIRFFDQHPTNAVATGQVRSWNVGLSTNAQPFPVRVTLVWTDPPGNPTAGIKLVNDLDLVVSNTVTRQVYYGNNIPVGADFTVPTDPLAPPERDFVNNVENVFIRDPLGSNFVVSVIGRRVNVDAAGNFNQATGGTNDIVQDFALVISTADLTVTNAFTITPILGAPPLEPPQPVNITNGLPVLNQRVGAQPPLVGARYGVAPQWSFYVFTNTFVTNEFASMTNGTNVAFVTFVPPNLSRPRNFEADIDLYVSTNASLLTLDPTVLDSATKSVRRGGTEFVVFTNATDGQVFYIGIKAEDQQGGEFGLIGISSNEPFERDQNGNRILQGFPLRAVIPDGSASQPGGVQVLAIGISPTLIQRVIVTNIVSHENFGDLIGILSHDQRFVVLQNHTRFPPGTNVFVFDDFPFGGIPGSRRSDGPGSLETFLGQTSLGVWLLDMVDNSPTHTGRVESLTLRVVPLLSGDLGAAGAAGADGTVDAGQTVCYFADVPPEATNMIVKLSQMTGPIEVFIERERAPTPTNFAKSARIGMPGGTVTLGSNDQPDPLIGGSRYFICLSNTNSTAVSFHISTEFELGLQLDFARILFQTNALTLGDNGRFTSSVQVPVDRHVSEVEVGVRIDHPRAADLVLHLVSPQGTRVLLAENRGGLSPFGYGAGFDTNITYTFFTENTTITNALLPIKFSTPPFTNVLGATNTPIFADSFESIAPGTYSSNSVLAGWLVAQGSVQVHGTNNILNVRPDTGTNFLELDTRRSPASIVTTFSTEVGKSYILSFAYHRNPAAVNPRAAHALALFLGPPSASRSADKFINVPVFGWRVTNILFQATGQITTLELGSLTSAGPLIDSVQVHEVFKGQDSFVLPEESLSIFRGQRALGEWRLEITDSRGGPSSGIAGALLNWQLRLKYAQPQFPAVTLTNAVMFTGALTNNQTNYFMVDVCDTATIAINSLTSTGAVKLLADRTGLPLSDVLRDDYVAVTNRSGTTLLQFDTNSHPAPLRPGAPYFLAVHNLNPNETNSYTIQVTLDRDECHAAQSLIRLINNVPYTNSIPPSRRIVQPYIFTTSCDPEQVVFELVPQGGDLGLVVRKGPPPPFPDQIRFDYASDRRGDTNEIIIVTTNSVPVPLRAGDDWLLGVFNNSSTSVTYTIRAREVSVTGSTKFGTNIVTLTNGVPLDFLINYCPLVTNYFLFSITNPVPSVKFEVSALSHPADLFIGFKAPPTLTNFFLTNALTNRGQVIIETNASLPSLVGDWYLYLTSRIPANLSFILLAETQAREVPTNLVFLDPRLEFRPPPPARPTNICFLWDSLIGFEYQVQGKDVIDNPIWVNISPRIRATSRVTEFCADFPTPFRFFRVVQFPQAPPPPAGQFLDPQLQFVGTNQLCLSWPSRPGTNYFVEAKINIDDKEWLRLSPIITATATPTQFCIDLPTRYRFFRIAVVGSTQPPPPPATNVFLNPQFLNIGPTNLCLAWSALIGTNYFVEAKTNITDAAWLRISPQITATRTNEQFCIPFPTPYRFFRIAVAGGVPQPPPPPPPVSTNRFIDPKLEISANTLCLMWDSRIGAVYHAEAKTNITDTAWSMISQSISATSTNSRFCIGFPTPYRFFRIVEQAGDAPVVTPLQSGVIRTNTIRSTNLIDYYSLAIPTNAVAATFELAPSNGDLGMLIKKGQPLPTLSSADYRSDNPGNVSELFILRTNIAPVPISAGDWFVGVYSKPANTNAVTYTLRALLTLSTNAPPATNGVSTNLTLRAPAIVADGRIEFAWNAVPGTRYEVQVRTNLFLGNWLTLTNLVAATNSLTFKDPSPTTNTVTRFYRVRPAP